MIKTKIYDKFACLADQCDLTCCRGWSVRVEQEDMDMWKKSEQTQYLCGNTSFQKKEEEIYYQMKLDTCKACTLLDEKGLCEIVKRHGDEYLSKTCREFPRKHNVIYEYTDEEEKHVLMDEYAMSGACPRVLQLLDELDDHKVVEIPAFCKKGLEFPMEYKIRNMLLYFMQETEYTLEEKIMLCIDFLHECLACEWEDDVYDCIEVYKEQENQEEHIAAYVDMQYEKTEALDEILQTFLDMTEFYKEEDLYRPYLAELFDYIEKQEPDDLMVDWEEFKEEFIEYEPFFTKVMCSEIFLDCISDDMEVLIECFQSIVMEYVMTRVSLFAKMMLEQKNTYIQNKEDIVSYLSLYIRMIGHNVDGMAEYWEDNFEDPVLEKAYLYLLLR